MRRVTSPTARAASAPGRPPSAAGRTPAAPAATRQPRAARAGSGRSGRRCLLLQRRSPGAATSWPWNWGRKPRSAWPRSPGSSRGWSAWPRRRACPAGARGQLDGECSRAGCSRCCCCCRPGQGRCWARCWAWATCPAVEPPPALQGRRGAGWAAGRLRWALASRRRRAWKACCSSKTPFRSRTGRATCGIHLQAGGHPTRPR
mmetsp:Transcript_87074/g.246513  ORF Transcript_87074/g.246513 Transcript_87074/m.246513 type:complete len:203 (+) Transcript_87074:136-744(+)